tara:strand:+ start:190 stop:339 length:150 start_codon:yes stop_codon:yes gene_type:complete
MSWFFYAKRVVLIFDEKTKEYLFQINFNNYYYTKKAPSFWEGAFFLFRN